MGVDFKNVEIYCCCCQKEVSAVCVGGSLVYPHRKDLESLVFYQCPVCANFVSTHKKTGFPMGVIANQEMKRLRMSIHSVLDPLWKNKMIKRKELYCIMSAKMGIVQYHTAFLRSVEECRVALSAAKSIQLELSAMGVRQWV